MGTVKSETDGTVQNDNTSPSITKMLRPHYRTSHILQR